MAIALPFFCSALLLIAAFPLDRYWTDASTSHLVAEVLLVLEQQQQQRGQGTTNGFDVSSSSAEYQLLAFWLRVMPSAKSFFCD
jgi:hypothetical protein